MVPLTRSSYLQLVLEFFRFTSPGFCFGYLKAFTCNKVCNPNTFGSITFRWIQMFFFKYIFWFNLKNSDSDGPWVRNTSSESIWKIQIQIDSDGLLVRNTSSESIWKIQIQMDSDGLLVRNTSSESIWKIQIHIDSDWLLGKQVLNPSEKFRLKWIQMGF